jgi:hypothetical protein
MVDINLHTPSSCIEHVEDIHLMLEHLICKALREKAEYQAYPEEFLFAQPLLGEL